MKTRSRVLKNQKMSADAFAGFLRLWLTPTAKESRHSADVAEYVRWANEQEPLPDVLRRMIRAPSTDRAA